MNNSITELKNYSNQSIHHPQNNLIAQSLQNPSSETLSLPPSSSVRWQWLLATALSSLLATMYEPKSRPRARLRLVIFSMHI